MQFYKLYMKLKTIVIFQLFLMLQKYCITILLIEHAQTMWNKFKPSDLSSLILLSKVTNVKFSSKNAPTLINCKKMAIKLYRRKQMNIL